VITYNHEKKYLWDSVQGAKKMGEGIVYLSQSKAQASTAKQPSWAKRKHGLVPPLDSDASFLDAKLIIGAERYEGAQFVITCTTSIIKAAYPY
jgi:hypothetical protein